MPRHEPYAQVACCLCNIFASKTTEERHHRHALQAFAVLGNVMSLVGGMCSMCCSLLLPSLFYLILYKEDLSLLKKCGVVVLLLCGVALLVLIVVQNIQDLFAPSQVSAAGMQIEWHMNAHAYIMVSSLASGYCWMVNINKLTNEFEAWIISRWSSDIPA